MDVDLTVDHEEETMGKTAREVMTGGAECVGENETMVEAAKKMASSTSGRCRSAEKTTASRGC